MTQDEEIERQIELLCKIHYTNQYSAESKELVTRMYESHGRPFLFALKTSTLEGRDITRFYNYCNGDDGEFYSGLMDATKIAYFYTLRDSDRYPRHNR